MVMIIRNLKDSAGTPNSINENAGEKRMKKALLVGVMASLLAGCSSTASRMAECEAQGVSKDACYIAEQNRKATINAAAEKQAMENAQALYPVQKAQAAKAPYVADPLREATFTAPGVVVKINNGFTKATVNGAKGVVKRYNASYYEISGNGYTASISLNNDGVEAATYTKAHSRAHGVMQVVQK